MAYTTIDKPSKYFNTNTWTGNGTTQSITGLNFSPDWVWIKKRSGGTARSHQLYDVIRTATKYLHSDTTDAEGTFSNGLTAFNSDGFSIGDGDGVNGNTFTYVGWSWDANGAGVSNTQGSITSTVSANTTSGFSIVSYTSDGNSGATVGHGLGVAPKMVIVKRRNSAEDWGVGHTSLGWTNFLRLNTTGASSSSAGLWNNTAPSSTVVTLGNSGISNNGSGTTMIMYCFAEVKGFSKFGSYTGNGSTDGTFVYTGFKPAFVLYKVSSTTDSWMIMDNKRDIFNQVINQLEPNVNNAAVDNTARAMDFLSNGFKFRSTNTQNNQSGATYIYMAFAENPFVSSTGIPTTAR